MRRRRQTDRARVTLFAVYRRASFAARSAPLSWTTRSEPIGTSRVQQQLPKLTAEAQRAGPPRAGARSARGGALPLPHTQDMGIGVLGTLGGGGPAAVNHYAARMTQW